ncbi:MAG TPA: hypothetical protein VIK55_19315 [Paludibacter sp.]
MKRLIFLLIAFACGLTASIAADVGTKHADYLQNPFVITQITPMPVMAVTFEPATAVYNFTRPVTQTALAYCKIVETDGWRAPVWIPSLAISYNDNLNVNDSNYNIRLNRKLNNYPGEYGFTQNIRSTARHVFVIFS